MDFKNGQELLMLCQQEDDRISSVMKMREVTSTSLSVVEAEAKMNQVVDVMKETVRSALDHPRKSMSGLLGGEGQKIFQFGQTAQSFCGSFLNRVISYSMAVLEVSASMGVIVAAPTAGSSGVLPGALLALQEEQNLTDEELKKGLWNSAAIGYLLMRNASVSGAEAGCQAEVGAASAMAASAITELMGGTPNMCLQAAALAIANLLGLVCDPVAGLVEIPCQSRGATGAVVAATSAEIILSGVEYIIPFDEMTEAMYRVGKSIPYELRETAIGGCAGTATGCACRKELFQGKL